MKLPADADADAATATHEDGLLVVTVPKAAPATADEPAVRVPVQQAVAAPEELAQAAQEKTDKAGGSATTQAGEEEFEAVEAAAEGAVVA